MENDSCFNFGAHSFVFEMKRLEKPRNFEEKPVEFYDRFVYFEEIYKTIYSELSGLNYQKEKLKKFQKNEGFSKLPQNK